MINKTSFYKNNFEETNYENTNSSFECFSKCIQDSDCEILARYHPSNKEDFRDCVKIPDISDIEDVQDAQYAKIKGI